MYTEYGRIYIDANFQFLKIFGMFLNEFSLFSILRTFSSETQVSDFFVDSKVAIQSNFHEGHSLIEYIIGSTLTSRPRPAVS